MTDSPPFHGTADDAGERPGHRSPPRTPRWVKASRIIALVVVVLVVIMLLAGGHGPGRHLGGGAGEHTPPAHGHTPR